MGVGFFTHKEGEVDLHDGVRRFRRREARFDHDGKTEPRNMLYLLYSYCLISPANPLQPGLIYFKTPRKVQLFGIHTVGEGGGEGEVSRQVNYLIDETSSLGKGANMVISLLHHFLVSCNCTPAQTRTIT